MGDKLRFRRLLVMACGFLLLASAVCAQQQVLVLHSYHHGFTWSDSVSRGIRGVFDVDPGGVELRFEFMDTRHWSSEVYFDAFAALLRIKYADQSPDVVICADDHALEFMLDRGQDIMPGVPIAFCSVTGYRPEMREGRQITGLRESLAIAQTLELALRRHPGTREVVVLTDSSRTGRALQVRAEAAFAPFADRVAIRYVADRTVEDLQQLAPTFGDQTLVFLFIFGHDRDGRVFSHERNLDRLAPFCSVPIYTVWDFYLGHGVVGGKLADGELEGAMVAVLAQRILAGEDAAAIPLGESPTRYMFDWRQLDRFGVDGTELPPGSIVINRPFSFYQAYRVLIWSTLATFVVLVGLIAALFASIARRRRVEMAVRASERRLRAVFEGASNVGFIIVDATNPGFTIQEFSPGAETIFGYRRDDIVGKGVARLHLPEDAARLDAVKQRIQAGREGIAGELTLVRRDGERFPAWLTSHPLYDDHGRLYAILGVVIDTTARKRAEEARELLEAQLRHSQRLEAVGQLAGGVAHDFNNLLQAILGYGELAEGDAEPGTRVHDSIQEVLKASERAKVLVSQLLAFSRQQILEMTDVDLNESVAEMMKMLHRVLGEHIELEVIPGGDLGTVRADRGQVGQILTNLCINARDAMPEGGTITIETENADLDEAFREAHAWARPGRYVRLRVTDTGTGMDANTLGRVFEPFFTTKEVGKGTGLGLATVYGLVQQHGGLVQVASEVGQGTTFGIYLPRIEAPANPAVEPVDGPIPGGTETILLAEDDAMVRKLSKTMLERVGYTVLAAADGEEAVTLFAEHYRDIDLVVLDVVMPKLGGDAAYVRMRAIRPRLRALFSSGYGVNSVHTNFMLNDDLALIRKPYRHDDLVRCVRDLLDQE